MKRTELKRKTPMTRTPLSRSAMSRAARRVKPKRRRDTGPTTDVRAVTWARDAGRCLYCGMPATDLHHRRPRMAGGSRDPRINLPSNTVWLCRRHHDWFESQRLVARSQGYLLTDVAHATIQPVETWRGLLLLNDDGTTSPANEGERDGAR